jgi:calcineurin-like phosphoesterase family protein
MARIALISDIHANALALRAVLTEIHRTAWIRSSALAMWPQPNAVIDILGELGCPCIMGNHDEFLLDAELVYTDSESPPVIASINWSRGRLSGGQLNFLRGFERFREVSLGRESTLQLFHGSPRSHMEDILASTPAGALNEMLGGTKGTVLAGGHTHIQMLRQHHGCLHAVQRYGCWPRRIRGSACRHARRLRRLAPGLWFGPPVSGRAGESRACAAP